MQSVAGKSAIPSPSEWDFRSLTVDEARRVIRYEYAREVKWFIPGVREWHATPFKKFCSEIYPLWADYIPGALDAFECKTVSEVLRMHEEFGKLPPDALIAAIGSTPLLVYHILGVMAWWFPEFPQPYLEIEPAERRRRRITGLRDFGKQLREALWFAKNLCMSIQARLGNLLFLAMGLWRLE
jgi:hypothetical protein